MTKFHYNGRGWLLRPTKVNKEKNMACGEPAGCHYTKEEMAKKREFATKVMKTIAIVSAVCIILYYVL